MEKRTWAKLIVIIVLIGGIGAGLYRQWYWGAEDAGPVVTWGSGRPSEGEKSYYANRIESIIVNWQNTRRTAEHDKKGLFKDSYKTILVVDTDKNAVWIEDAGLIQQDNYTELTANMKWTLHHFTLQGNNELGAVTRIKMRGYNSSHQLFERFHLVGSSRGAGHVQFHFGTSNRGSGSGSGKFSPPTYNSSREVTEDTYASLIMTDAEYEQYLDSVSGSDSNGPSGQDAPGSSLSDVEKNKARWVRVEKLLYQQIEQEVLTIGFALRSLKIEPGPDFSAAHAKVGVRTEGVFRGMFGGYYWGDVYLKIDLVGDDIWYAADAENPQQAGIRRVREIDLEFLACPIGEVPESKRAELLKKGRGIQKPLSAAMPSKWKARLPNGVIVQFIGICENPSAGKKWWGPDGAPIDYIPYANDETYGSPHKDREMYEMAWKVEYPQTTRGNSGRSMQVKVEGSMGSYSRSVRDKYGNRMSGGLGVRGYSFKKSRKKTVLRVTVRIGDGESERVEFQNISLVRGEDHGFEVRVIRKNPPSKWKITLSNGVTVELLGICEGPTAGKKWWGGDGTILEYPPFYTTGSSYSPGKGKRLYEMTWNVHYPSQNGSGSSKDAKFHIEDSTSTRSSGTSDRYGDVTRWSYAKVYAFDKSRREATAKLEVRVGGGEYQKVEFKNMSLVPGEDRGFKIELEKKE